MKRITVGLVALVAAGLLAIPGMAAASGGVVADEYPATLNGTGELVLNVTGTQSCPNQSITATLGGPSAGVTATAGTCGTSMLKMNGCKYEFHPGSQSFDIGPAGCGPVTSSYCPGMTIPAQTGLPATYKNTGSGKEAGIRIEPSATLEYSVSSWSPGCGAAGTYKNLKLNGWWTIAGVNGENAPVGIYSVASGDLPVGLNYDASEKAGSYPFFSAQSFPVAVKGQRSASGQLMLLDTGMGQAKCESVQLTGPELTSSAYALELGAQFGGCDVLGFTSSVKMNSCRYVLIAGEGLGSTEGRAEVKCANSGDKIEVLNEKCSIKIGQQNLGVVEYGNSGSGKGSSVNAQVSASKVQITKEGPLCFLMSGTQGSTNLGLNLYGAL